MYYGSLPLPKVFTGHKYPISEGKQEGNLALGNNSRACNWGYYQLNDLFHAMMLPSGNDAAQTIADYFDKVIKEKIDKGK